MTCLTGAAGPFLPTKKELKNPGYLVYAAGALVLLLPVIIAFLLRNILHQFRRPFCLSVRRDRAVAKPKSTYSVATSNLCLMPELFSKFNNLDKTAERAVKVGERIVVDQMYYTEMMETFLKSSEHTIKNGGINSHAQTGVQTRSMDKLGVQNSSQNKDSDVKVDVIAHFPQLDFLCLQETFDRDFSKLLVSELHKVYPWIVFDVGYNSPRLNYCGLNSGLMFASRYEILEIKFKSFSSRCGFCTIVNKGLLMVKVSGFISLFFMSPIQNDSLYLITLSHPPVCFLSVCLNFVNCINPTVIEGFSSNFGQIFTSRKHCAECYFCVILGQCTT